MIGLVDTHCHLDDVRYAADRADVIGRAAAAGVRALVVPGTAEDQWEAVRALAAATSAVRLHAAVGTHPHELPRTRAVPRDVSHVSAVGECGLDGKTPVPMDEQVAVLAGHLGVARDAGLPVLLHCYKAHPAMLALLRRYAPVRGVLHSYSGGAELVDAYVACGLHLSFAGAITWENARKPLDALRRVPLERLLFETDGPDQCPRPHRGRNEPSFLPFIVAAAERVRGEPLADVSIRNAIDLGFGPWPLSASS